MQGKQLTSACWKLLTLVCGDLNVVDSGQCTTFGPTFHNVPQCGLYFLPRMDLFSGFLTHRTC